MLEQDPYDLEALMLLGRALLDDKRHQPALEAFQRVLKFTPEHVAADLTESLEVLGIDTIDLYFLHRDDVTRPVGPLVEALGAIRLRSDLERKRVHGLAPLASSGSGIESGLYSAVVNTATYRQLGALAQQALRAAFTVVVCIAAGKLLLRRLGLVLCRWEEGTLGFVQMATCAAAVRRFRAAGLPYISVMTHPTTGGVSASFAMLGDINLAEPEALIGFAGPRVIEQTVREKLPEGFQRSEFLLEHGAIDQICDRRELRDRIASLVALLMKAPPAAESAA